MAHRECGLASWAAAGAEIGCLCGAGLPPRLFGQERLWGGDVEGGCALTK